MFCYDNHCVLFIAIISELYVPFKRLYIPGPLGSVILGTMWSKDGVPSFDCWKAVLRDSSDEPSSGRALGEVLIDPRVSGVTFDEGGFAFIHNIYGDKFALKSVQFNGEKFMHAQKI